MSSDELCWLTATELARRIAARELSPVEVVDAVLARAAKLDPTLNLFAMPMFDQARDAARAAERAVTEGAPLGPLHGVPITVKDNVAVAGLRLANGSTCFMDVVPAQDAAVVARIKAAGAIIIGKTNLPEFAHKVLTDSPAFGVTRSPWSLDHTPGGSSGGASAALAAGVAPLALGTDGGGSIRCPSSCGGLVGLKATLGRIPFEAPDGFANYSFVGPMARRAEDAAVLLSVMAGPLAADPYSLAVPPLSVDMRTAECAAAGMRIGWVEHFGRYRTHSEVARLTSAAVRELETRGARVEELHDAPALDESAEPRRVRARSDYGVDVENVLEARVPLYPFNLTGHPALSAPAGFTEAGLPVGLQLVGPWFGEERLLRLARLLEMLTPWHERRPPLE
jgi:aspartyl-tRNA(Asn)/glutamyl-tRNA(Gln) amidotransferase subunit A